MSRIEQKITPFLWFDTEAEEAAGFYVSLFDDSEVVDVARYPEGVPGRNEWQGRTTARIHHGRRR